MRGLSLAVYCTLLVFFGAASRSYSNEIAIPTVTQLSIFDSEDSVVETIDISVDCCGPRDKAGKYQIVLVRPKKNGGSLVTTSTPRDHEDTIVIFGWLVKGRLLPIFPWSSHRIFSRPLETGRSPIWQGLEESSNERKSRIVYPTKRNNSVAWGYKLPSSVALASGLELYVSKRPEWQHAHSQLFEYPASGLNSHSIMTSVMSSQHNSRLRIMGNDSVYSQTVSATPSDKVRFFFLPKRNIITGDAVNILNETTAQLEKADRQSVCFLKLWPSIRGLSSTRWVDS